jgi:hypothetical protein
MQAYLGVSLATSQGLIHPLRCPQKVTMGAPYSPRKITNGTKGETTGLNQLKMKIKSHTSVKLTKINLDRFNSDKSP